MNTLPQDVIFGIYILIILSPSALPWIVPSRLVEPVAILASLMLASSIVLIGVGPTTVFLAMTCTSCLAGAYMKRTGLSLS